VLDLQRKRAFASFLFMLFRSQVHVPPEFFFRNL
jgi:hypothetical protein